MFSQEINELQATERQHTPERNHPVAVSADIDSILGMNVTKVGDGVLQTPCGEFDSHRLHFAFVPQLVQEEPCKFSFVSSTLTEGCYDLITQRPEYSPFKRRVVGSNPTGVIVRLIVQWTEQLASNEKVPGSNPGKASMSNFFYPSVGAIGSASFLHKRG